MKLTGFVIVVLSIAYMLSLDVSSGDFTMLAPVFIGVALGFFVSGLDAFRKG